MSDSTDSLGLPVDTGYLLPDRSWFASYARYLIDVKRGAVSVVSLDYRHLRDVVSYGEKYSLPPEAILYAERRLREAAEQDRGDSRRWLADAYAVREAVREQEARRLEGTTP